MNYRKHGVRFEEARTIFDDPLIIVIDDLWHSYDEERLLAIGQSSSRNLLVVSYVVRDDETRLITARPATTTERRRYMRGDSIRDRGKEPEIDLSESGLHQRCTRKTLSRSSRDPLREHRRRRRALLFDVRIDQQRVTRADQRRPGAGTAQRRRNRLRSITGRWWSRPSPAAPRAAHPRP